MASSPSPAASSLATAGDHAGRDLESDPQVGEGRESIRAFAREGVSHVQVYLGHSTFDDVETFASVLALLDADGDPAPI
jgi:hypothetical protein